MITVYICVGTACHIKGAPAVIKALKEAVAKNGWQDKVSLKVAFCLNKCGKGVTVKIGEEYFTCVTAENAEQLLENAIQAMAKEA